MVNDFFRDESGMALFEYGMLLGLLVLAGLVLWQAGRPADTHRVGMLVLRAPH